VNVVFDKIQSNITKQRGKPISNEYPLYSVIIDGVEVATVGSDEDAKIACDGKDVKFIDKKVPSNVKRKEWDEYIQDKGYYTPL
jgi:hypothetical protein